MKKTILATTLALASFSVNADCFVSTALTDIVSTDIAVSNGAVEANPLDVSGVIIAKAGVYAAKKVIGGDTEKAIDTVACPIMAGAYVNNFGLAAGLASKITLPIGVMAGGLYVLGARFGPWDGVYPNDMEVE